MKVEFFRHSLGEEEARAARKALQSLILTTGETVEAFERDLARYLGARDAVGLMSCTSALHLALLAAGVRPGDEVITTPLSFVATANAIMMAGAVPVFVDVEPETGNINAALIPAAITKKTRAIIPVHLYGQMADMRGILQIAKSKWQMANGKEQRANGKWQMAKSKWQRAKSKSLVVIEDAAHALEARRDGMRPGQKSFGACFSFYATKSITSGEGGAFATQSRDAGRFMRSLRSHGITSEMAQRRRTGLKTYDVDRLGWKSNMSNIQAALLLPQLRRAERQWRRRKEIADEYRRAFQKVGIEMPRTLPRVKHSHHLFPIFVGATRRGKIMDRLAAAGVETVINYPAIHLFSLYRKELGYARGDFPVAESIASRTISLPLYPKLTDREVRYVIHTVKEAFSLS